MRLSSLVLAPILVISPFVLAQHRAETTGSSTPSSGGSSAPTYSGGSSTSSSPTYSGGSSSSNSSHSSSSGSSSSSSSSSASHSSASSGSGTYHGSGASSRGSMDSGRSSGRSEPASRVHDRNVRNSDSGHSNMTGATTTTSRTAPADNARTVRDAKSGRVPSNADRQLKSEAKPEREKRNFFLFWRHPKRDPSPDLRVKVQPPKRCKQGENCATAIQEAKVQPPKRCKAGEVCPPQTCPPGSYWNDKNGCVTPAPTPAESCPLGQEWDRQALRCVSHSVICPGSEHWDGVRCVGGDDACGDVTGRGSILANELRGLKGRMQLACSQNPDGQECFQLTQSYSSTLARYRMLYDGASVNCRLGLFDPLSF